MYRFKYRRYEDTLNQNLMLMQLETGKKQNKNASFYFLYMYCINYPIIHNHVHTQYSVTPFASSTGKRRHALILRCFLVLSFAMCFANLQRCHWLQSGVPQVYRYRTQSIVVSWYVLFLDIFLSVLFYSVLFFLCIPELECNHSSSQPGRVKLGTYSTGG